MRQMVLVGFLQAQNCTILASSWRHPLSRSDFTTAAYYQKIGQVLEAGKFQLHSSTTGWRCRTSTAATPPRWSPTACAW